jgi:exodeoxyribonuclease VII large subunit
MGLPGTNPRYGRATGRAVDGLQGAARVAGAPLLMDAPSQSMPAPRIWAVGALCRAVADALDARFNPVAVRGEVSGFSRAPSGHCYFTLKDAQGQVRCAMFRRAASLLGFVPRDGDLVEAQGRLGVYEPRGDLQLVVESLSRAGQGAHFEQFLRLKAKLEGARCARCTRCGRRSM